MLTRSLAVNKCGLQISALHLQAICLKNAPNSLTRLPLHVPQISQETVKAHYMRPILPAISDDFVYIDQFLVSFSAFPLVTILNTDIVMENYRRSNNTKCLA